MAPKVAAVLDGIHSELIIDCRSSTYQTVWQSPTQKTVEVKVFTTVNGVKKVITHMSKKTRGDVTRHLIENGQNITTPDQLQAIVAEKFECELIEGNEKKPWILRVFC